MRYFRGMVLLMLPVLLLSLSGCGSSGSGTFSPAPSAGSSSSSGTVFFGNVSTATGKLGIALTTDRATIDVNIGQVLATATLTDSTGKPVTGRAVTFSVVAGPATVVPSLATVFTDSTGKALTVFIPGDAPTTTNVILQATTLVDGQTVKAYTSFQIVRGGGVIMFTDKAGTSPGSQSNQLEEVKKEVDAAFTGTAVSFLQQLPFKVTDANGNPRVGVPVTLAVYNQTGAAMNVAIDNPVIATDSAGQAIFNVVVTLATPPAGGFTAASVIYQATTGDAPLVAAYVGGIYSLTRKAP